MSDFNHLESKIKTMSKFLPQYFRQLTRSCEFPEGLTFNQSIILDVIEAEKIIQLTDLSKQLMVDKSTTTRVIQPLLEKGLIEKLRSEDDGRRVFVKVTPKGKEAVSQCWNSFLSSVESVLKDLPKEKVNQVLESVELLMGSLSKCC